MLMSKRLKTKKLSPRRWNFGPPSGWNLRFVILSQPFKVFQSVVSDKLVGLFYAQKAIFSVHRLTIYLFINFICGTLCVP
jgi:hypothetical protein